MAIAWRHSLSGFGPVIVFSDPYSLLEWKDVVLDVAGASLTVPLHVLIDARYCSPPTSDFVVRALSILQTQEDLLNGGRVAVVVGNDTGYSMGRLAEAAADLRQLPFLLRTFRDWSDAEHWLSASKGRKDEHIEEQHDARRD